MNQFLYRNGTSPWFFRLFRRPLWLWLKYRFNIQVTIPSEIRTLEGPYVLIANHVTFWDPFIAAIPLQKPVRFIASDNLFRRPLFRWIMKRLGAIPKTKFVANPEIVSRIMDVIHHKGIIGIFPEGHRTWDGRTDSLMPEVSKLLTRLGLPVVRVKISGGYLSHPIWSRFSRKGEIIAEYSLVLPAAKDHKFPEELVFERITEQLQYNCEEWQEANRIAYKGRKPAEYLERVLYICPVCESAGRLISRNEQLFCPDCGYSVRYTETGGFAQVIHPLIFSSLQKWNDWQTAFLHGMLTGSSGAVFSDENARLWFGYKSSPLRKEAAGSVELLSNELRFRSDEGTVYRFPAEKLEGLNMQGGNNLEFYYGKVLHRINFTNPRVSCYKYLRGLLLCRNRDEYIIHRNTDRLSTGT